MDPTFDHSDGYFPARDGVRLYRQTFTAASPRAEVCFVHGYGDHSNRYRELFERLAAAGISTHALDLRGHGKADGRRGYVSHFAQYLDDVEVFAERIRTGIGERKLFLIGHSMGALVVARALEQGRLPAAGAVFASPYLGLALRPSWIKVAFALVLGRIVPWLKVDSGIRSDQLTRDKEWQEASDSDPLYEPVATPRWFVESNKAREAAMTEAAAIELPSLVLLPEKDPIAEPATTRAFFDTLGAEDKELIEYPAALHELFHEVEATRSLVFADVEAWILDRLSSKVVNE